MFSTTYTDFDFPNRTDGSEVLQWIVDQRYIPDNNNGSRTTLKKAFPGKKWFGRNPEMNFELANRGFFSNFSFKPYLQQMAKDFIIEHEINNCTTLGVHYRGTDKGSEAKIMKYKDAVNMIADFLTRRPYFTNIFITSDESNFTIILPIELEKKLNRSISISFLADPTRLNAGMHTTGSHHNPNFDGRTKLKFAVVNMLILSRCAFVLRTASALSAFARVMRPDLPTLMMSTFRRNWYPDNQMEMYKSETLDRIFPLLPSSKNSSLSENNPCAKFCITYPMKITVACNCSSTADTNKTDKNASPTATRPATPISVRPSITKMADQTDNTIILVAAATVFVITVVSLKRYYIWRQRYISKNSSSV